jgi:hypothetical protein
MATVAVAIQKVYVTGDRKRVIADVTLTGSYISGGETLGGTELKLETELNDVEPDVAVGSGGVFLARWANGKLLLHGAVDATPAANEQSPELAAGALPGGPLTLRVRAIGKGTAA